MVRLSLKTWEEEQERAAFPFSGTYLPLERSKESQRTELMAHIMCMSNRQLGLQVE